MNLTGRICHLVVCLILCFALCSILTAQPPPAPPQQAPENIDRMLSIGLYDWLPSGGPSLRGGINTFNPAAGDLKLPQKPSRAYGVMFTMPAKGSTRLEFSYLTLNDRGNALAPRDLIVDNGTIPANDPLAMDYSLRHFKLSWNYLTYPNPPQDAKLRIKTLWEVHYMQIKPTVVAASAPDVPLTDSQRLILPAVGLGMEFVPSRHFRMEWRASGMGFPKRSALGDGEASIVVRVRRLEIFAGGKALYFRTSPKKDTYINGTLWGPYGGVRWVFP